MNRKIKTLGLALVAALALTAVTASAAQASFTLSAAHSTLSGAPEEAQQFTAGTGVGAISCTTATLAGTATGTSVSIMAVKPTFGNCKDSLGRTVHVQKNTLFLHLLTGSDKGKATLTGHLELTVTTPFGHCTITVQGHQTINGISYANFPLSMLIFINSNNVTSTISGSPFACGVITPAHSSTGTFTGKWRMTANGGGAMVNAD
jgi:hypothetical protein